MTGTADLDHGLGGVFVLGSFVVACSAKVAHLPRPGESLRAEAFTLEAGGKGLNLALGARRLGASVSGLMAVGDDMFGQLAEPALARAGLPSAMLRRYPAKTGSGIGFTDAEGENCLAVHLGANCLLSAADLRASADELRCAGLVLAQFEIEDEPVAAAFALARAGGIPTILNPSPYRMPSPDILARTSILVLNRIEAVRMAAELGLAGIGDAGGDMQAAVPPLAAALHQRGPGTVIVTLGANGAMACRSGEAPVHQPAFSVRAIDTLGAGDAFTAGLAVSLLERRTLGDSLMRAAACGALATQRLGVFDAMPTRDELEAFLKQAHP